MKIYNTLTRRIEPFEPLDPGTDRLVIFRAQQLTDQADLAPLRSRLETLAHVDLLA